MSEPDDLRLARLLLADEIEGHAAELAIVKAQRDALGVVVLAVWSDSRGGHDVGGDVIESAMFKAGLVESKDATENDPDNGVEVGDELIELSAFGRACLADATLP
jgi:hypothetical protein